MAAIDFPSSPSNGDTHTVGGVTYTYNSTETKWKTTINSNAFLPLTGGTVSGNIVLDGELQHSGDTDTKLHFDTDTIKLDTAGSERFRVGSAGQLGIGGATYGSDGQVLTSGGASAAPSWADAAATSVAVIADKKAQNTNGGTFTASAWQTRDLNTEISDPDGIVSISSNDFTLGAGTYLIQWTCPAYLAANHVSRLYDVTNTTVVSIGSAGYSDISNNVFSYSHGSAHVTITANTAYRIQHQCNSTKSTNGLGAATNLTGDGEIYTIVTIFKVA